MDMRAGGAALAGTPDTPKPMTDERVNHLHAEFLAARKRSVTENARYALMLRDENADICELAKAADEAATAATRLAGFARLLCRALPLALLIAVL